MRRASSRQEIDALHGSRATHDRQRDPLLVTVSSLQHVACCQFANARLGRKPDGFRLKAQRLAGHRRGRQIEVRHRHIAPQDAQVDDHAAIVRRHVESRHCAHGTRDSHAGGIDNRAPLVDWMQRQALQDRNRRNDYDRHPQACLPRRIDDLDAVSGSGIGREIGGANGYRAGPATLGHD